MDKLNSRLVVGSVIFFVTVSRFPIKKKTLLREKNRKNVGQIFYGETPQRSAEIDWFQSIFVFVRPWLLQNQKSNDLSICASSNTYAYFFLWKRKSRYKQPTFGTATAEIKTFISIPAGMDS